MALTSGRIAASNNIQAQSDESQKRLGWVHDIILDETHEYPCPPNPRTSPTMASRPTGRSRPRTSPPTNGP